MSDWNDLRNHLMRGGSHGFYWTVNGSKKLTQWWQTNNVPTPPTEGNIYFGVNPVIGIPTLSAEGKPTKPEYLRSRIAIIAAINCLFAEFDGKDYDYDKQLMREIIYMLDPEPTVVIDSGGGYHAYWLLDQPFYMDSEHARAKAKHLQASWVTHTGGDNGAKDLARVLRVPNTYNVKASYAPDYPLVRIMHYDDSNQYPLATLEALLPPMPKQEASVYTPSENGNQDRAEHWLEKYIRSNEGRNKRGVNLANQLRDDGISQTIAESIMRRFASAVTGEQSAPYPEKEALRTLQWSYAQTPRRPAINPNETIVSAPDPDQLPTPSNHWAMTVQLYQGQTI